MTTSNTKRTKKIHRRIRRPKKKPSRRATRQWVDENRPGEAGSTVYFRLRGEMDEAVSDAHARFCKLLEEAGLAPMTLHQLSRELLLRGMAPGQSHSEANRELDRVFAKWLKA